MFDRELILLIFAPATVGLIVTALRRMPPSVYWFSLVGIITLTLVIVGQRQLSSGALEMGPVVFAIVLVVIPTIAAFSAGRLVVLERGGAWVFAATCSAYLVGLGLAAVFSVIAQVLAS